MVETFMRRRFEIVVGLFSALLLSSAVGCGGGKHEPAKAPEGNPWADYKGTYAGAPEPSRPAPASPKSADTKAMSGSAPSESKADDDAGTATAPAKKASGKKRPKAVAKKAPKS
ncbi:hypothetical protein BH11MYX4_BH11MYX4_52400 [soil metagenome]